MNQQAADLVADSYPQVPAELKALPQWVVWKYETRKDKPTKVLFDPKSHQHGSSTDLQTWTSSETALAVAGQFDGIGFALAPPFVVIDLDKVRNPQTGQEEDWAAARPGQCHEVLCDPNVTPYEEDSRHESSY